MNSKRALATVSFALLLTPLAGVLGCGNGTAVVSGKVTYNGKPITSGVVVFIGPDGKPSPPAPIQTDGTYQIAGVPTGLMKVAVDNPPPQEYSAKVMAERANDPEIQEAAKQAARYVPTPQKYTDCQQSGLTAELESGNNEYNIELR